jgi:hypothetical protein
MAYWCFSIEDIIEREVEMGVLLAGFERVLYINCLFVLVNLKEVLPLRLFSGGPNLEIVVDVYGHLNHYLINTNKL